jgi:hypothetical protein
MEVEEIPRWDLELQKLAVFFAATMRDRFFARRRFSEQTASGNPCTLTMSSGQRTRVVNLEDLILNRGGGFPGAAGTGGGVGGIGGGAGHIGAAAFMMVRGDAAHVHVQAEVDNSFRFFDQALDTLLRTEIARPAVPAERYRVSVDLGPSDFMGQGPNASEGAGTVDVPIQIAYPMPAMAMAGSVRLTFSVSNMPPIDVTWAAGETVKVVAVPIPDDAIPEADETITLCLVNPSAGVVIGRRCLDLRIVDDDLAGPGVLQVVPALDFGEVNIGETAVRQLSIRNIGSAGLRVASIEVTPDTAPVVTILAPPLPTEIAPGGEIRVPVVARPNGDDCPRNVRTEVGSDGGSGVSAIGLQCVDDRPPEVNLHMPGGGKLLEAGGALRIQVEARDNVSLSEMDAAYSSDDGATWLPAVQFDVADLKGVLSETFWEVDPVLEGSDLRLRITARDAFDNPRVLESGPLRVIDRPDLDIVGREPDGSVRLRLSSAEGRCVSYVVEAGDLSGPVAEWTEIGRGTMTGGQVELTDSGSQDKRFYRARLVNFD